MIKLILILFFSHSTLQFASAQWFTQQSGTTNPLYDIEFINKNTGWCCGDGGYIIKTTNGGVNWIQQSNGVPGEPLFGIHPVDSNIVYAVGFYRTLIKTTNGGSSWFSQDSGTIGDGTYTCVFFINENTGWIGNFESPDYGVKKTTDGGKTLTTIGFGGVPNDLFFRDSLKGISVNTSPFVFSTVNGGVNWFYQQVAGSGDFYRVSFIDVNTGFTASHKAVYRTTNFGLSWDSVGNIPAFVYSISFASDSIGYAGTGFSILKSINGGKNWIGQVSTGVVYSIFTYNESLAWTCGNGGRIWHTSNGGTTFIQNFSSIVPDNFKLHQNYPNPFNPVTSIKYEIPAANFVTLNVYDVLGKQIFTLVNSKQAAGKYSIDFNAGDFASGVYFYKIEAGDFEEIKRMLLLK
jgi:photosystem II stability/assembly factor-like uncharacterized protein